MKWPLSLTLIRHGQSAYNVLKAAKANDTEYQEFLAEFRRNPQSQQSKDWVELLLNKYRLEVGDYDTPLTVEGERQSVVTGRNLIDLTPQPDVIIYSPYLRTQQTLAKIREGAELSGRSLNEVPRIEDDRIREQGHGLSLLYNDWRFFHVKHPEQAELRKIQGPYWYQFPQGESVSMVRDRVRSMIGTLIREYAGKHVLMITHHLAILSIRANLERLTPDEFIRLDQEETPVNCGVTMYLGHQQLGKDGKLIMDRYNQRLY